MSVLDHKATEIKFISRKPPLFLRVNFPEKLQKVSGCSHWGQGCFKNLESFHRTGEFKKIPDQFYLLCLPAVVPRSRSLHSPYKHIGCSQCAAFFLGLVGNFFMMYLHQKRYHISQSVFSEMPHIYWIFYDWGDEFLWLMDTPNLLQQRHNYTFWFCYR